MTNLFVVSDRIMAGPRSLSRMIAHCEDVWPGRWCRAALLAATELDVPDPQRLPLQLDDLERRITMAFGERGEESGVFDAAPPSERTG